MSEDLGTQIQNMFKTIYDATDIKYLRPIKRQMFKCGIECLEDRNSAKQAEQCTDDCGRTMHKALGIVQNEVTAFQGRIDRCLMDCQDSVRNEKEESKAKRLFDDCAEKCVKKFVPLVPEVVRSLCENLDKLKKEDKIV